MKVTQSCPTICDPADCLLHCSWDFPGKNTGVGCHSLLQGVFLSQELDLGLLHCRQIFLLSEPPEKSHISHECKRLIIGEMEGEKGHIRQELSVLPTQM